MVEGGNLQQIHDGAGAAGLRIHSADHAAVDPGLDDRAGTHLAGLQGDVDGTAFEAPVAQNPGGFPDRVHLGVGDGIAVRISPVISPGDDFTLVYDHASDRDFVQEQGFFGLPDRFFHVFFIFRQFYHIHIFREFRKWFR